MTTNLGTVKEFGECYSDKFICMQITYNCTKISLIHMRHMTLNLQYKKCSHADCFASLSLTQNVSAHDQLTCALKKKLILHLLLVCFAYCLLHGLCVHI